MHSQPSSVGAWLLCSLYTAGLVCLQPLAHAWTWLLLLKRRRVLSLPTTKLMNSSIKSVELCIHQGCCQRLDPKAT